MATLEELDRRVTALEKAAQREQTLERAVAEIVSDSERRVRAETKAEMSALQAEMKAEMSALQAEMKAEMQRLTEVVSAAERRMVDTLNDRFDAVMMALDRRHNPPA